MVKFLLGICSVALLVASCKKEVDHFTSDSINDYFPLEVGKYITYDLDSTVFLNFGNDRTVIHYQVQDRVEAQITDNLDRAAYRITRYLRKDSTQPWVTNNVFMAIPTGNSIEYIENNLRYIKLMMPIKQDFSWKGNSYIDSYSNDLGVTYLNDWDYIYDSIGVPLLINTVPIDNSIRVDQRDEYLGGDPNDPNASYAQSTYSVEKYGKGIGLIYRDFLHWEYQGPQPPASPSYYTGYGVTMTIIDHN